MKKTGLIAILAILTLFGTATTWKTLNNDNRLTGDFKLSNNEKDHSNTASPTEVESVKWRFDNGKTVNGRIARQNFTPGTYNVTLIVEKTDGTRKTYRRTLKVER